jgi:hypothetical protein
MNFEEFENLARLHVVGALEEDEEAHFEAAREGFGQRGEELIAEFCKLNSVFALSLRPHPPHPDTKRKLLQAIRRSIHYEDHQDGDGRQALSRNLSRETEDVAD